MHGTIIVNPITAGIAAMEIKRLDGAILRLDSAHRMQALRPDGTEIKLYGPIHEADNFLDAAREFLADVPNPTERQGIEYQDELAGVAAAAFLETGSESATDGNIREYLADVQDEGGPGNTEAEILAGAD